MKWGATLSSCMFKKMEQKKNGGEKKMKNNTIGLLMVAIVAIGIFALPRQQRSSRDSTHGIT